MDLSLLDLSPGSVTQVVGASGAGLSTLAATLHERHGAAVVLQDATAHLSYLRDTVIEEVAFGLEQRGMPIPEMEPRVRAVLNDLDLGHLAERNPTELSGGQTRRLAIASVLVLHPDLLVLDDSFAGLDADSVNALARVCNRYPGAVVALGHQCRPEVEGRVLGLANGALTRTYKEPMPPPVLPEIPPVDCPPVDLGMVSACRGGSKRRWWRFGGDVAPTFTVGPVHVVAYPGEIVWLRGANGSGKTTLLRALAGLDGAPAPKVSTSLMLQRAEDQVVETTAGEFIGDDTWGDELGLDPQEHPLDLPTSQLRQAQTASVLAQDRDVVLMDEPDVGLDDLTVRKFWLMVRDALAEGRAIIMTCHNEEFLEAASRWARVRASHLDT